MDEQQEQNTILYAQAGDDVVVVIGRGCLGRPWLFRDLVDAFEGRTPRPGPTFGEVADIMVEHARLLVHWFESERLSMLAFRKHSGWYTRGFRNSAPLRDRLMRVETLAELEAALATVHRVEPYPANAHEVRRGKRAGTQKVVLPPGYLDDLDDGQVSILIIKRKPITPR